MADETPKRTTDATTATLATIAPIAPKPGTTPADGFTVWEVRVIGVATNGERAGYVRTFGMKHTGGTVSLVGLVPPSITVEDVAGWNCSVDVSGGVVRVRVTGAVGTEIDWYLQHAGPLMGMGPNMNSPRRVNGEPVAVPAIPNGCGWSV